MNVWLVLAPVFTRSANSKRGRATAAGSQTFNRQGQLKSMANHFSALKRARQTEKRTAQNRVNKSRLRTALRHLREKLAASDKEAATLAYRETVSVLDKSVQKGVLHANTASRYKSRLAARLNAVPAKSA
jgi:small subunit ribosomal protein S20